ncbi:three-helix bundle dimerization domain-containing protein [Microbacterium sp. SLBN-146]|uniref:three-helix bundle dimerization domain-containing protein n=1 Tax=Microbacterium sp. SLBN-146 TaxID=2768457 RepID=UPI00114DA906|nr:hypothetical protein [Microbacterium sp. SLBN-146]TQJ30310.1 hypothetical protein FBY39_0757 [Microbacterium sp. SLBN-146]
MDHASDHEASDRQLTEEQAHERADLDSVVSRVSDRFPTVDRERVESVVDDEAAQLEDARVRDYIPVLVEHEAVDRLRQEADPVSLVKRQTDDTDDEPQDGDGRDHDPALRPEREGAQTDTAASAGPLLGGLRGGD